MSVPPSHSLGVSPGQPGRVDFHGQAHLIRLAPGMRLEIPRQTIDTPKQRRNRDVEDQWRRQESLLSEMDDTFTRRGRAWDRFSNPRRQSRQGQGHVAIDTPPAPTAPPAPTFTPQELKAGKWVEHAAHFEEEQRATEGRYGASTALELPGRAKARAQVSGRGRRAHRRTFYVG